MGRTWFRERFTRNAMSIEIAEKAMKLFQGAGVFTRSKVIHSTSCYLNEKDQLFTINIGKNSPKCLADLWVLNFLRCYSDCILTTGQILRQEPLAFHPEQPKALGFDPKVFFEKPKPVCVMTNTLNKQFTDSNLLYHETKYRKLVLTKPQTLQRFEMLDSQLPPQVEMKAIEDLNMRRAIKYLQEQEKHKMILVECGPSTTIPAYSETHQVSKAKVQPEVIDHICDGNPIDTLVLSMFVGTLKDSRCLGYPFLNRQWLDSQYNLVATAEDAQKCEDFNGHLLVTVWRKKSLAELEKIRGKSVHPLYGELPNPH